MTAALRAKKSNKTLALILLGLLVLSLLGFGVRSVGRGGGAQAIGSVGTQKVTVDTFVRALNTQVRALSQQVGQSLSIDQARAFGVEQQVVSQVMASAALDDENVTNGLSVGDDRVKQTLLATQAFQDVSGKFDETAYKYSLDQAGLKPGEYDSILRHDSSRLLLRTAITSGISTNDTYAKTVLKFLGETRNMSWAIVSEDQLRQPVPDPTADQIKTYYDAHHDAYTLPEIRKITYVLLTPDILAKTIKVEDSKLRETYDAQTDRFHTPEKRSTDRVVFANDKEAQAAIAAIESGTKTFEAIVTERGLKLADVSLGDVTQSDLTHAAAGVVFALAEPGIAGPVTTDLGPAIFRVNAILKAKNKPFDAVRDTLKAEYVDDQARRQVDDAITGIDDLLASGATLEEIANETHMELGTIDYSQGMKTGVATHVEFRKAADAVQKGDFPEVVTLSDAGMFALRLDEIKAPQLQSIKDVKKALIDDWNAAETHKALLALAATDKTELDGGQTFAALLLKPRQETDVRREAQVSGAPRALANAAFKLKTGKSGVVEGNGVIAVVRINAITAFDTAGDTSKTLLKTVRTQYEKQIGTDLFQAFASALQDSKAVTINQPLINAVFNQRAGSGAPSH